MNIDPLVKSPTASLRGAKRRGNLAIFGGLRDCLAEFILSLSKGSQ